MEVLPHLEPSTACGPTPSAENNLGSPRRRDPTVKGNDVTTSSGQPSPCTALIDARLESLRSLYEKETTDGASRAVRVAPYVLASSVAERRADLELIRAHVHCKGWQLTLTSFADLGQAPPVTDRSGFNEACRYATQGFAHGIVAISRQAVTTDNTVYEELLDFLRHRGVFLAFLPGADGT